MWLLIDVQNDISAERRYIILNNHKLCVPMGFCGKLVDLFPQKNSSDCAVFLLFFFFFHPAGELFTFSLSLSLFPKQRGEKELCVSISMGGVGEEERPLQRSRRRKVSCQIFWVREMRKKKKTKKTKREKKKRAFEVEM